MPTTTLLGLPSPPSTGVTPDVPRDIKQLADKLEANIAVATTTTSQSTSSGTPVDLTTVNEVTLQTSANFVPISVHALVSLTPSASGDAKVNLFIDGVDYGVILTAAANSGAQQRATMPGSNTGIAITGTLKAGGWMVVANLLSGSHTIALRYSSVASSASFAGRVLTAKIG